MSWAGGKVTSRKRRGARKKKNPRKRTVHEVWDLSINGSQPAHQLMLTSYRRCWVIRPGRHDAVFSIMCRKCPLIWRVFCLSQIPVSGFHFYSHYPLLSGCTAEPPRLLILGLRRTLGEGFDKGVECFIPPRYSEVNYRYNNQFHATRQRFYDVGDENGGLRF